MGLYEFSLEVLSAFGLADEYLIHARRVTGYIDSIKDSEEFGEMLERRSPLLHNHLVSVIIPRTRDLEVKRKERQYILERRVKAFEEYEAAMSPLHVRQPEMAYEIERGFSGARALGRNGYRIEPTMRQRKLYHDSAKRKKKWIGLLSAGLGGLNAVSCLEVFGVDVGRLTVETLFFGGIGLFFSVSSMTALHLGLVDFIGSTRDSRVSPGEPITKNLFPYGWQDKALWVSAGVVVIDALFSSIGLIQGLSPLEREDTFWKIAILCVSGFGSLVNVLLAWGIALDRLNYELQLKVEGDEQQKKINELGEYNKNARAKKRVVDMLDNELARVDRELVKIEKLANAAYQDLYQAVYFMLMTDERDRRNHPSKLHPTVSIYEVRDRLNGQKPNALPSQDKNGSKDSKHP